MSVLRRLLLSPLLLLQWHGIGWTLLGSNSSLVVVAAAQAVSTVSTSHQGSSVWDILQESPTFFLFREGLESAGLSGALQLQSSKHDASSSSSSSSAWTVFAVTNDAFLGDLAVLYFLYVNTPLYWSPHLKALLTSQLCHVAGFTEQDLFEDQVAGGALRMRGGSVVSIDPTKAQVGGQSLSRPDFFVTGNKEGVIHGVDGFLEPIRTSNGNNNNSIPGQKALVDQTLLDLVKLLPNKAPEWQLWEDDRLGSKVMAELSQNLMAVNGTTLLVPLASASEEDNTIQTEEQLLYHILDENVWRGMRFEGPEWESFVEDEDDLDDFELVPGRLVKTKHPLGVPMVVSWARHTQTQIMSSPDQPFHGWCNNVAMVGERHLVSNGILYTTEQVLQPPRLTELWDYARQRTISAAYLTDFSIAEYPLIFNDYFDNRYGYFRELLDIAATRDTNYTWWPWNRQTTNNAGHGADGTQKEERFTVLVPEGDQYGGYWENLKKPEWSLHMEDFLNNLIFPGTFTKEEYIDMALSTSRTSYPSGGGVVDVQMFGGRNRSIVARGTEVYVDSSASMHTYPPLIGVDGEMLFFSSFVADHTSIMRSDASDYMYLDTSWFAGDSGITFFYPPDSKGRNLLNGFSRNVRRHVAENHIFEGIFYYERLLEMDGQVLMSTNGQKWTVSVLNEDIFLQPEQGAFLPTAEDDEDGNLSVIKVTSSNNTFAMEGVIHYVDNVLLDRHYGKVDEVKQHCAQESLNLENCGSDYLSILIGSIDLIREEILAMDETSLASSDDEADAGCGLLLNIVCESSPYQQTVCRDYVPGLLTCYAKESLQKDLSSCFPVVCPTRPPTPEPTNYPTRTPTASSSGNDGNGDDTKDGSINDDDDDDDDDEKKRALLYTSFGIIGLLILIICTVFCVVKCHEKGSLRRRLRANPEGESIVFEDDVDEDSSGSTSSTRSETRK